MQRTRLYWILQVSGWLTHALANFGFALLGAPFAWRILAACLWADFVAGFSSHLFRAYIRRHGWLKLPLANMAPRVVAGSDILGSAATMIIWLSWLPFGAYTKAGSFRAVWLLPSTFVWSITIFLWAVIYCGVHYFENHKSAEIEKLQLAVVAKDVELRMLLSQVNPHFIFNCLNSLRALIVEDPARAQTMVNELSGILRYSLQSGKTGTVPLESELEAIAAYLKLEAIRFEERLHVTIDAEPASFHAEVPPMLVQTLVENGVKHGIATLTAGGEIRVSARVADGKLTVQVVNSGQLVESAASTQIGINNARERLRLLYGNAASLLLRNRDSASVLAEVVLPVRGAIA